MPKSIEQIENEIIEEFLGLETWEMRYKHLIHLGKNLAPMNESDKTEELKVKGCQSQVWLKANITADGLVQFQADSDALIVKGLVALLLRVFSDQPPMSILEAKLDFIEKIELNHHLSASRTNGLNSMIQQIRYYAKAFHMLLNR